MEPTSNIFKVTVIAGKVYFVVFQESLNFKDAQGQIRDDISGVTDIEMLNGEIVYI